MPPETGSTPQVPPSHLSGAAYVLSEAALGAIVGAIVARYTASSSGMGWDQIANTLGGLMAGGAIGLVAGLLTMRRLTRRARVVAAACSLATTAGLMLFLNQVPPPIRSAALSPAAPPAVAQFSLTLGVGDPLEGAPYPPVNVPWRTLRIYSSLSYDFVPASRPTELCVAAGVLDTADGIEQLKALRSQLAALPNTIDCGPPCPTCADIAFQWNLDQVPFSFTMSDRCWLTRPELAPVRASIARIASIGAAATVCEKTGMTASAFSNAAPVAVFRARSPYEHRTAPVAKLGYFCKKSTDHRRHQPMQDRTQGGTRRWPSIEA